MRKGIYVKSEMRDMPDICLDCRYLTNLETDCGKTPGDIWICAATGGVRIITENVFKERSMRCPLIEI